jgi:HAD superfamily hydrolase (TIGR01509 family)
MRIDNIIFDLDDTLIPSTTIYDRLLQQLRIDSESHFRARLETKLNLPTGHVVARNRFLYFKRLLEDRGPLRASELMDLITKYENHLFLEVQKEWSVLGRDATFEHLARNRNLGIITNENTRSQIIKLNAMDPRARYFQWIVTSEEIGVEKPNLRIFEYAIEKFKLNPETTMFVGDSVIHDIEPAQKLGLQTCLTEEFVTCRDDSKPSLRIPRLADLASNDGHLLT